MPNYIDVFTKKGNHFSGVREHESVDIDYVYRYFKEKAQQKYTLLGTQIKKRYIKKDRRPPREGGLALKIVPVVAFFPGNYISLLLNS